MSTIKSIKPISTPSRSLFINKLNRDKLFNSRKLTFIVSNSELGYSRHAAVTPDVGGCRMRY